MAGLAAAFGSGAMTNSFEDIMETELIMLIGSNTTESHPVAGYKIKQAVKKGAKLIVIDPRNIELASYADLHLQLKPGTNLPLLNAMAHVIIEEGLYNEQFIRERTEGFDSYKDTVKDYSPEAVAEICGVPAEKIREAARMYAKAGKAMILYTMGVTQFSFGTYGVLAVANLAMLTGHVGKDGAGVNPLRGQNNVQGACDMGGLPNVFTGYQRVDDPAANEKFSKAWGVKLPEKPGLTLGEMFDGALKGNIKAMYIMGENPVLSDPDARHIEEALKKLDFLVVQDIFLTETAKFADVVLPAATFAEKDGTFTNTERRVQRVRKAIPCVGEAKPDWEIIALVATKMGYPMSYSSAEEIFDEMRTLTPSYAGITYERLEKKSLQWPCPAPDHPGTKFLHSDKFVRGKGLFHPIPFKEPEEKPDSEYPFTLITGRRLYHYHTGTMSRRSMMGEHVPEDHLEMNPADAKKLNIKDGDRVRVTTRRGSVEIKVALTDKVPEGTVFASFHFFESPVNQVTNPARDPMAKTPELKYSAAKIEKL